MLGQKRLLRSLRSKIGPPVRSRDLDFLQDRCISTIGWRVRHIFDIFVLKFHVTLTFDLLTLIQCYSLSFVRPMHVPILRIIWLSVPELWITLSIWSTFRHMEQSLRMRCVTLPITGGQKRSTFFKFLTPIYLFTLTLSRATRPIKPCYRRTIASIPLWRHQSSVRKCSITWPVHNVP